MPMLDTDRQLNQNWAVSGPHVGPISTRVGTSTLEAHVFGQLLWCLWARPYLLVLTGQQGVYSDMVNGG